MVALLIEEAYRLKTPLVILEWMRSEQQQKLNIQNGVSWTMKSKHLEGLAIDVCFLDDLKNDSKLNYPIEKYKIIGEFWEHLGGRWGGRFGDDPKTEKIEGKDAGHFEYL